MTDTIDELYKFNLARVKKVQLFKNSCEELFAV